MHIFADVQLACQVSDYFSGHTSTRYFYIISLYMLTISIDRLVKSDLHGYSFLANFYKQIVSQEVNKEFFIDFVGCQHFDANLSAALGALLDKLSDKGYQLWLTNVRLGVKRTLSRNHFLKAFEVKTNNQEKEDFIEYKRFSRDEATSFKEYIQTGLIDKRSFPEHSIKAGNKVLESIYEIYANAIMHGKCDFVYCCGELNGVSSLLDVTIVDCGNTIPFNVNEYCKRKKLNEMNSCKAIEWSMKSGNTTKDVPGGLGLAILQEFIMLNKGALQIVSADGMLEYRNGITTTSFLNASFPGTIVNMEFNFNDENFYRLRSEIIDINNLL